MATSTPRTTAGTRKSAILPSVVNRDAWPPEPALPEAVEAASLDATLDHWSNDQLKEQLSLGIDAMNWIVRSVQSLRELQLATAQRAGAAYREAADQLKSATGVADFNALQLKLARENTQAAVDYLTQLGEATTRHAGEAVEAATSHLTRLQTLGWSTMAQWSQLQAALPQQPDVVEAEFEHLANPLAASPFAWPAQEATRQAFGFANSAWNDLVNWSGHWADGATAIKQPH